MTGPDLPLEGMTALVAGAGGGIGAAIAVGIAQAGARVGLVEPSADRVTQPVEQIQAGGGRALALAADVTDPTSIQAAVTELETELGALQLAVNCAGVHSTAPAEEMEREAWQRLLDVNLTGVFLSCQAEGRAMLRGGRGSIVNIGSISGTIVNRGINQIHYNSSKAAVLALSRSLAMEWVERGIRVNVLSPGYVRTGMARGVQTTRTIQEFLGDIPMHRLAEPAEMVGAAVFLLSEAASYCTGSELLVDGGLTRW